MHLIIETCSNGWIVTGNDKRVYTDIREMLLVVYQQVYSGWRVGERIFVSRKENSNENNR
jgi:hypothetical protein